MKITTKQLKQLIREELALREAKELNPSSMPRRAWRAFEKSLQALPNADLQSPALDDDDLDLDEPGAQDYRDMQEEQRFYLAQEPNGNIWIAHEEFGPDGYTTSYTGPFTSTEQAVQHHERNTLLH